MKTFTRADIDALPQRYRAAMINSVSGFKSASMIGTVSAEGQPNLCIVSSVVHLGSNPPLMGFVMRPPVVPRHTYENILSTGFYTINHVSTAQYREAHQSSASYAQEVSEFEAVGLPAGWREGFPSPYVAGAPLVLGMKFIREMPIEENDTRFIIGEVVWMDVPEDCIASDGYVNIEKAGTVTLSGLDAYHRTERLARLSYAKPDKALQELTD